jgi:hypothetical protein
MNEADWDRFDRAVEAGAARAVLTVLGQSAWRRDPLAALLRARAALFLDDIAAALDHLAGVREAPGLVAEATCWRARALAVRGDAHEALSELRLLPENGGSPSAILLHEVIVHLTVGEFAAINVEALASFAAELTASGFPPHHGAACIIRLARNLKRLHEYQPALAVALARRRPWDRFLLEPLGDGLRALRRTEEGAAPLTDDLALARREVELLHRFVAARDLTRPAILLGVGSGQLVEQLLRIKTQHQPPRRIGVIVIEPDDDRLSAALLVGDLAEGVSRSQLRLARGAEELADTWRCEPRLIPRDFRWTPLLPEPRAELEDSSARVARELARLERRCRTHATQVDLGQRQRLSALASTASSETTHALARRPLGLLIQSCTATTFIDRHLHELAACFRANGAEVTVFSDAEPAVRVEPAAAAWPGPAALLETIAEREIDVIVQANVFRRTDHSFFPRRLKHLTIIEDHVAGHLSSPPALSRHDFVVAQSKLALLYSGYPADRVLAAPVTVRAEPLERDADRPRRYERDLVFVSHSSRPPASWMSARLAQEADAERRALLAELLRRIVRLHAGDDLPGFAWWHVTRRLVAERASLTLPWTEHQWLFDAAQALDNLLLRHTTLQWLAEDGRDLHLYGDGWEHHPTLSRFARGRVEANDLPDLVRGTRINLQLVAIGSLHQRLFEILFAGGFPLLPLVETEPRRLIEGVTPLDARLAELILEHPVTTLAELARLDPEAAAEVHRLDRVSPAINLYERLNLKDSPALAILEQDLLSRTDLSVPEVAPLRFGSRPQLRELVDRWLKDDAGREAFARDLRGRPSLRRFTAEFQTGRILRWLRSSIPTAR